MRLVCKGHRRSGPASDFGGLVGRSRNCDVEPAWTEGSENSSRLIQEAGFQVECDPTARTPRPGTLRQVREGSEEQSRTQLRRLLFLRTGESHWRAPLVQGRRFFRNGHNLRAGERRINGTPCVRFELAPAVPT